MSEIDDIIRAGKQRIGETESVTRERLALRYRETWQRIETELGGVTRLLKEIEEAERLGLVTPSGNWTKRGLKWRQQRLSGLLRLVESEYDRLAGYGVQDIAQGQRTVARQGIRDAEQMVRSSGVITSGVGPALNTEAYEGLVAATEPDSPVARILQGYGPFAAQAIEQGIISGAMQGWGVDRILREIRAQVPGGVPAWRLETVVRTEILRAYRQSLTTSYQAMGVQEWQWTATLGSRTCPSCLAMHGRRFPMTQTHFPAHPNCRCVAVPVVQGIDTPTGEEWLRSQPEDVQRRVIPTPAAYDAWRDGDVTLDDFVGYRRSRTWGTSVRVKTTREVLGAR